MAASMYTKSIHRDTVGRQTPLSEKAKQHKDVRAWLIYKAVNFFFKKVPKASTFCIYLSLGGLGNAEVEAHGSTQPVLDEKINNQRHHAEH